MPSESSWGPLDIAARWAVHAEKVSYGGIVDRLALDGSGNVQLLIVVAAPQEVKGLNAALQKSGFGMSLVGFKPYQNRQGKTLPESYDLLHRGVRRCDAGYVRKVESLKYGMCHASWVSRDPCFVPVATREGLWHALNHPRLTTPLLRSWMPYVSERLVERELLIPAYAHRCFSAMLTADSAGLDRIVSEGIRSGALRIEGGS